LSFLGYFSLFYFIKVVIIIIFLSFYFIFCHLVVISTKYLL
jgi:hypothetical protein